MLHGLSANATFARYDERGCGLSDWKVSDLGFDSWLRDLETVVAALGGERFSLLGISQGASIAIAYAARHPERVSHLVLHGGYARGLLVRSDTPAEREEAEMMCRLVELGWGKEDPSYRQFFTSQFIPGGTPEQHRWFNELERIWTSPANAARFLREFNNIDITDLLAQVRCPTLVLHNTRDVRVPFAEGGCSPARSRMPASCRSTAATTWCWSTSPAGRAGWPKCATFCRKRRRRRTPFSTH